VYVKKKSATAAPFILDFKLQVHFQISLRIVVLLITTQHQQSNSEAQQQESTPAETIPEKMTPEKKQTNIKNFFKKPPSSGFGVGLRKLLLLSQ